MTIRKGSSIIAGYLNNSYTAGNWVDIDQNEISAKGSTNIELTQSNLYCWYSSYLTAYTLEEVPVSPLKLYDSDYKEVNSFIYDDKVFTCFSISYISVPSNPQIHCVFKAPDGIQTITFYMNRKSSDDIVGETSDDVLPTQKAVKTYVDTLDSNVVHLTGDETIEGNKTFQNILKINESIRQTRTDLVKGTLPSDNYYFGLIYDDGSPYPSGQSFNNENRFGLFETSVQANGNVSTYMCAFKNVADVDTSTQISVTYPASGNPYTYAPTPTDAYSATSGTQIATTGWTASNFVNLAGAQTINGEKTFLTTQWANPDGTTTTSVGARKFGSGNGDFYIFMKDSSGNWLNGLQLGPSGGLYIGAWNGTKEVAPFGDNTHNLGTSSRRWKQLYAGTTTIATSDERVKQGIEPLPDDVLDAWGEVEFYRYKFNDAVEEKGFAKARYHTGMVAQRIEQVFAEHGLNAFDYGLLCYDEWEAVEEEKDKNGEIIRPARVAGNRYSLRYEECLCMEAAYQRRRADRIEERLEALEAKLK